MITSQEIQGLIASALPDAEILVEDTAGDGDHWSALVVSEAFAGRNLVARHRLVYGALGDAMFERIHALSLKTHTPAEAKKAGLMED